jgi:hypothetical protein
MSGTANVCAFYALFAIVILVMWRTSSWIGIDGLIAGYRQRRPNLPASHLSLHFPRQREAAGTAAACPVAEPARAAQAARFPGHRPARPAPSGPRRALCAPDRKGPRQACNRGHARVRLWRAANPAPGGRQRMSVPNTCPARAATVPARWRSRVARGGEAMAPYPQ